MITRCMLGLPLAPAIGLFKEITDFDGFDLDDIRANNTGTHYAYNILQTCKKSCDPAGCPDD